ncbi:hypothetical protein KUCAC02_021622 [Chaenocephalus aceratus]|uniref:Uncharacterized protein n=1 Tax=Chaenocephalus aceratus TaxID=36190 RepID=A0ACB9XFY4_CHAAC|nr:hypothetical protein KUCAC02_021622 [Chaenocephalus aceratus]
MENTRRFIFSFVSMSSLPAITMLRNRTRSEGEWKLPKHILLCVTVRHLFRSKQLTTILHRLGHSESYGFGLELEIALAKVLDKVSSYRTPAIVIGDLNMVFHCEWDNLNKTTPSVHGSNIVNSAGGIMVQVVKPGFESNKVRMLPVIDKSQQRSLKVNTPETLPPLYFTRADPKFNDGSSFTPPAENDTVYATEMQVIFSSCHNTVCICTHTQLTTFEG